MPEPVLTAAGLGRRFGAVAAVEGVSIDLRPGEVHALIGPNGAGKTTLLRLLAGEIPADAGTVRLEGSPLDGLGPAARARAGLARSFQVSRLAPSHTALAHVALAVAAGQGRLLSVTRAVADERLAVPARAALARVGLEGRERVAAGSLSHGERRRLEIAIALALRPRAFLLDEPMAGLGADGSAALTALLDGLRREAPILLVEHDMDAVFRLADRISVLVGGRLLATGPPDAIRADAAVREAYLGEAP